MSCSKILKYDPGLMQKAIEAVRNGQRVKTAAETYNVPRTTLYYKITGKYPEGRKMGPQTNLTAEEETILVNWLFECADKGFPITKEQLLESVEMLMKEMKRKNTFKNNKPGEKWFYLFLRRHPEVAPRLAQNLTQSRASVTESQIREWFTEVETQLKDEHLLELLNDPRRVFNSDETAIFLSPKGQRVLAKRGNKTVYAFSKNGEKECVTLLVTANALGMLAPPMALYKYERIPAAIIKKLPDNWANGRSENGWMTGATFFEYMSNVFEPWLSDHQIERPVIFFIDGHSSHITYTLSIFCRQVQIVLIALLPNSTHILQPMDVSVFRPLKQEWKKAVNKWKIENEGKRILREDFAPIMDVVLKSLNVENFVNGFRTCGLCPWNKDAVNYNKYFKETEKITPEVPKEPAKFYLIFLEKEIGETKLEKFKNEEVDEEDTSLYKLWKKYKTDKSKEENKQSNNIQTQMETEIQEENEEIINNKDNIIDENPEENIQNPININKDRAGPSTDDILKTQALTDILYFKPAEKENIPTPFKKSLFWPKSSNEKNKTRLRERIPSVITGSQGKAYFLKKERERERKLQEKEEKKRIREEKKQMKETEKNNKKNQKRSQQWLESSSESSADVLIESEGEGDDWAKGNTPSSDENENYYCPPPLHLNKELSNIVSGDYVIVMYQDKYYPGVVKTVNDIDKSYYISAMIQSGFNSVNFKWPQKEDVLWYPASDIKEKIEQPTAFGTRGYFKVHEMLRYLP